MPMKFAPDGRRMCGSVGCEQLDHHLGPCSASLPTSRRSHDTALPYNEIAIQQQIRAQVKQPAKRKRQSRAPSAPAPPRPESPPPVQTVLPNGLHQYYQPWGVPLPAGPVDQDPTPDSWRHTADDWKLEQTEERIRTRHGVSGPDACFMVLWNDRVHRTDSRDLVSDHGLPAACRAFAHLHAARLASALHKPFQEHLLLLASHNLLHADDVQDCLAIAGAGGDIASSGQGGRSNDPPAVALCTACTRPVHEEHCALFGKRRGAARWPAAGRSESDIVELVGGEGMQADHSEDEGRRRGDDQEGMRGSATAALAASTRTAPSLSSSLGRSTTGLLSGLYARVSARL